MTKFFIKATLKHLSCNHPHSDGSLWSLHFASHLILFLELFTMSVGVKKITFFYFFLFFCLVLCIVSLLPSFLRFLMYLSHV